MLDFAPSPTHLYENSNGLVTRWKMLQIDAANFVRLLDSLAELARMCETGLIVIQPRISKGTSRSAKRKQIGSDRFRMLLHLSEDP